MAGAVSPYETAKGRRYRVRWRNAEHVQVERKGFATKKDATLYLASVEVAVARGEYVAPAAAKQTVGTLAPAWLESKRLALKPSTFRTMAAAWQKYVEPRWGSVELGAVTTTAVRLWAGQLAAGTAQTDRTLGKLVDEVEARPKSRTHVERCIGVLAGILDDAVSDQRIAANRARGLHLGMSKVPKRRRYLSHAEVSRLAAAAGTPEHSTIVLLLAYCGLRWGELVGLRVRDVNLLRHRLEIRQNAVRVGAVVHVGTPKSRAGQRQVPFPSILDKPLARQLQGRGPDDLLFSGADGDFIVAPKVSKGSSSWYLAAQQRAGIERLTIHDLRHTAASLAISAGANAKVVQRMLGHASAAMTLDTYADLFEDDLDAVAKLLSERAAQESVGDLWAAASSAAK